jgi:transposase
MAEIKQWGENHLRKESIEENGGLGKAIRHFIKHYAGLNCFCRIEGVKLDNNAIEAMLKIVVRDRKNPLFHKTLLGARIGDVNTSIIAVGSEAGLNVLEYFTLLQHVKDNVKRTQKLPTLNLSASRLIRDKPSTIVRLRLFA